MKVIRKLILLSSLCALASAWAFGADAQTVATTGWARITYMTSGWTGPYLRVQLSPAQNVNPAACPTTDGFVVDANVAGNQLFNAQLLSAYATQQWVSLYISGCSQGRPAIIGVSVQPHN